MGSGTPKGSLARWLPGSVEWRDADHGGKSRRAGRRLRQLQRLPGRHRREAVVDAGTERCHGRSDDVRGERRAIHRCHVRMGRRIPVVPGQGGGQVRQPAQREPRAGIQSRRHGGASRLASRAEAGARSSAGNRRCGYGGRRPGPLRAVLLGLPRRERDRRRRGAGSARLEVPRHGFLLRYRAQRRDGRCQADPRSAAGRRSRAARCGRNYSSHLAVHTSFSRFLDYQPDHRSNRSRFITLVQAATKSATNFFFASALA